MTAYVDICLLDVAAIEEADLENQQSWSSWAWSYVPQILPTEDELQEEERSPKKKRPPAVLAVGMYAHKATLTFKVHILVFTVSTHYCININVMICLYIISILFIRIDECDMLIDFKSTLFYWTRLILRVFFRGNT